MQDCLMRECNSSCWFTVGRWYFTWLFQVIPADSFPLPSRVLATSVLELQAAALSRSYTGYSVLISYVRSKETCSVRNCRYLHRSRIEPKEYLFTDNREFPLL